MGGHVEGCLIWHFGDCAGGRDLFGVGRHDAGHIRPDFQTGSLGGGGVKRSAEIRPSAPEGCHLAVVFTGDESGGDEYFHFGLEGHGRGDIIIGESCVVFYDQNAGVQPFGAESFAAEFLCNDGGGEQFSESDHLVFRSGGQFVEEGFDFCRNRFTFGASKEPADDVQMPGFQAFEHHPSLRTAPFSTGEIKQRVGASGYCGTNQGHPVFTGSLGYDIENPRYICGVRNGTPAEFEDLHFSLLPAPERRTRQEAWSARRQAQAHIRQTSW